MMRKMPLRWAAKNAGRSVVSAASLLSAMLTVMNARAFEGQWHVGGGVGGAVIAEENAGFGPALGAYGAYGVTDAIDLRLEVQGGASGFAADRLGWLATTVGASYRLDIIEWVPWLGISAGYYALLGETIPIDLSRHMPGASIDLGLDYAVSRSLAFGGTFRYHALITDSTDSLRIPLFSLLLRVEHRWGF